MTRIFQGYRQYAAARQESKESKGCVLTLGNFDGVHLGHREILKLALERARELGLPAVAYTFRPHPRVLLQPGRPVDFITTYDEKLELLSEFGFDAIIEEAFTPDFSRMGASEFFESAVRSGLDARAVIVGYDFGFGKARSGHLEELKALCDADGISLGVVQALRDRDGEIISSSRIRAQLHAGEVEQASKLLGRLFEYSGIVFHGDARGRTIGFPTANLRVDDGKLLLPFGVYATWANVDGKLLPSVTNLGVRPTFRATLSNPGPVVETHILDFSGDLYDRPLEVRFARRLREERRFSGIEELKHQIETDVKSAREILRG